MTKVLFIHHSTGANLLQQGNVRQLLYKKNPNIELWDHSYNLYKGPFAKLLSHVTFHTGLSDQDGVITGKDYNIVLSNNSPKEYAEIFSRDPHDPTLSQILSYDIIAFKNCYPTTKITSGAQLEKYKQYYEAIRDHIAKYSNKFILFTLPPLRKNLTTPENAKRAQELVNWLTAKDFLKNTKNISVFNFFHLLADSNGFLKKDYCRLLPMDSHPNKKANREVGKMFVDFILATLH